MRAHDWLLLLTRRWHLRTDPSCREYRPVRSRTRLDRRSRGVSCDRCAAARRHALFLLGEGDRA